MLVPIILAGGSGGRLWPLSREHYPKQFLKLNSQLSMLQETIRRLDGIDVSQPLIICNEEHRFLVAEQTRQIKAKANILLEPVGRNTAPAIALAALYQLSLKQDASVMLVLAADHIIEDVDAFHDAVNVALSRAADGDLVTFGVVPTEPATAFGYIKGESGISNTSVTRVLEYVEKPDFATAQHYLGSGNYFWNSGMFMFRPDVYLEELRRYRPEIVESCERAMNDVTADLDFVRFHTKALMDCPSDSIDYAVMEKTDKAVVVSLEAGWSDVGSWDALWGIKEKDNRNNAIEGDVLLERTSGSLVYAQDRLVAAVGVSDLIVVDTKDAVLVAAKNSVQDVKRIVESVKDSNRYEYKHHREVFRPWGKYDLIDTGFGYRVKHITVNPGAKISLQKHSYRAEHWVVVKGVANVRCGDKSMSLSENQSTYIPQGEIHQLHNPEQIPLEIIEIQTGSYLGEDDIIRYEDDYGRDSGWE